MSSNSIRCAALFALAASLPGTLAAQATAQPWEEYSKLIESRQAVAAYGPDLFGDEVNLSNGALSFSATDIAIPGNNALEVALKRSYTVSDKRSYQSLNFQPFADWVLDTPRIEAVFAPSWKNQRCSVTTIAAASPDPVSLGATFLFPEMFWHGNQAQMPGGGEMLLIGANTPKPSSGGPYYWTTQARTAFSCLSTIENGSGEGFLAITSEGVKYWFNRMATYDEPPIAAVTAGGADTSIPRKKVALYATRVEDRFGNWVTYTYTNAASAPARLTAINSSDGRSITVSYNGNGQISSASNGSHTWTYQYTYPATGQGRLTAVVLPDATQWSFNFANFAAAKIRYERQEGTTPTRSCYDPGTVLGDSATATITHPSGAIGEFQVDPVRHGRSNVPLVCLNIESIGNNNPQNDITLFPYVYDAFTLMRKRVTGPGLPLMEWLYRYTSTNSYFLHPSGNGQPVCGSGVDCSPPTCLTATCAGTSVTEVAGPEGRYTRHTFGNSYKYNEGKLLKVERGSISGSLWALASATTILRSDTTTHNLAQSGQPFVSKVGTSPQWRGDNFTSEYIQPVTATSIVQDGVTFSATHSGFDAYARPSTTAKSGTASRTDTQTYHDNTSLWVLGQPAISTAAGIQTTRVDYNAQALPWRRYGYGQLQQTLTYNTDGTLASVVDGRNFSTGLSNWYRGIPRNISYPDGTGHAAGVNALGWITSVTEQNGFTTSYGYDSMGRINSVTPPAGDTVAWAATSIAFVQATSAQFGLPAGHWRRTETRGNYRKFTYYDSLWRPVVQHEYDNANVTATQRFQGWSYDSTGKATFEGYPIESASGIGSFTSGVWSTFDALGRQTNSTRSSELGSLSTTYDYLSYFQTRVTDPRGFQTTSSFQAFDTPDTSNPLTIAGPEGVSTTFARDLLGKPTSIQRAGGGNSATRSYVYDGFQRLCKQIDPETNATFFDYDANGNVVWSSTGLALNSASCDRPSVGAADRTVRSYDAMNRVTLVDFPDASADISTTYTPDGLTNTVSSGAYVNRYTYNRLRLPTNEVTEHTFGGVVYPYPTAWTYNTIGHTASTTGPAGVNIVHSPNALGQPTQAGLFAYSASYYPDGSLKGFTYGDGTVRTVTQNSRLLPGRIREIRSGVTLLDDIYTYDRNGNLTGQDDQLNLAGGDRTLSYDGRDRLLSAQISGTSTEIFTYDALDNIRSRQFGSQISTYNYDARLRLSSVVGPGGTQSFNHDLRGNMTNRANLMHTFDMANRLTAVSGRGNYEYDGHGRRTITWRSDGTGKMDVYTQDGILRYTSDNRRSGATAYVHLGSQLVAERFDNWGGGALAVEYVHADLIGSAVARTTGSGVVTERERSFSFGQALDGSKREAPGFTGHMEEPSLGLVYMQQRYYDPAIGRFLSVDPVGPLGGPITFFGRYHYASNNPYRNTDPDGACVRAAGSNICEENTDGISKSAAEDARSKRADGGSAGGSSEQRGARGRQSVPQRIVEAITTPWGGPEAFENAVTCLWKCGLPGNGSIDSQLAAFPLIAAPVNGGGVAIGKLADLAKLGPNQRTLLSALPNLGNPRANWYQNAGVLRSEMAKGFPIMDASVDSAGRLINNTGFLRAERNMLTNRGWTYNPSNGYWFPPATP
jgi:RHS repeat-associated protein